MKIYMENFFIKPTFERKYFEKVKGFLNGAKN